MPFFPPVTPPDSGSGGGSSSVGPGVSVSEFGPNPIATPGRTITPYAPAFWIIINTAAALTLEAAWVVVRADVSGGGFTITLPSAALFVGQMVSIGKRDASGNNVTVAAAAGDTLWSSASTIGTQYDAKLFMACDDGAGAFGWQRIAV